MKESFTQSFLFLVIFACYLSLGNSFSIPGVSLTTFNESAPVKVFVNEVDSVKTQLPYEYYDFNYCRPKGGVSIENTEENLGSLILGEVTQNSPYEIYMNKNQSCLYLCNRTLSNKDVTDFQWLIDREYRVNLVVDNLPAYLNVSGHIETGIPLGYRNGEDYYLNNHFKLILYIKDIGVINNTKTYRVTRFEAKPSSVGWKEVKSDNHTEHNFPCHPGQDILTSGASDQKLFPSEVFFSYDVEFRNSSSYVGTRWDTYKFMGNQQVHWISIMFSIVINLILTSIIGQILKNALKNDIRFYNELEKGDASILDSVGWKQVQNDVFRPPTYPLFLSVFIGTGGQVIMMSCLVFLFTLLGFVSESYRGSLLTTAIILYVFMGVLAGYFSARIYKMFDGVYWLWCTFFTSMIYPSVMFIIFNLINLAFWIEHSTRAVPFTVIVALIALWFGISAPLVFLGGIVGYKSTPITNPCRINPVPKRIQPPPWFLKATTVFWLGGSIPFGTVAIELFFMFTSMWHHYFYYFFVFLVIIGVLFTITLAEVSIIVTYLLLCNGDFKWWWKSFLSAAGASIYFGLFSVYYFFTELEVVRFSSMVMYFGYTLIVCFTVFIFSGTIGFISSLVFVRQIYSLIKAD